MRKEIEDKDSPESAWSELPTLDTTGLQDKTQSRAEGKTGSANRIPASLIINPARTNKNPRRAHAPVGVLPSSEE